MSISDYEKIGPRQIQLHPVRDDEPLRLVVPPNPHKKPRQASPSSSDQGDESEPTTPSKSYNFADITERRKHLHDNPIVTLTSEAKRGRTRKDKYSSHSILIRRKEEKNKDNVWISQGVTLEIRDKEIQEALKQILKDVRYMNLKAPVLILKHPYRELFWFEKELKSSTTSTGQPMEAYPGFLDLQKYVFSGQLDKLRLDYEIQIRSGYVTFDIAWTLYRPNSIVIHEDHDKQRAYIVRSVDVGPGLLTVECCGWACDDQYFGLSRTKIQVPYFDGTSKIQDLVLHPLEHMETTEREELKRNLVRNGRKWRTLLNACHKVYCGKARLLQSKSEFQKQEQNSLDKHIPIQIESRIILDHTTSFNEVREFRDPLLQWLMAAEVYHPAETGPGPKMSGLQSLWFKYPRASNYEITDQQALICPLTVRGFALEDKVWADFEVSLVEEIQWNLGSFEQVQLDQRTKDTVKSLVQIHEDASKDFKDIVAEKSKGLVMLLHGPPGTGKTLTAETLSETTQKPLLRVTSGDLGVEPEEAEQELTRAFRLAGRWNAILLLDEADVFLAARSGDIVRNGFVSIFLRTMEWFQGIMLLTTNRSEDFDQAFKSRIHLSIQYKPPDPDARRTIWKNIVREQQAGHELTSESFEKLSQDGTLNGREIKNLVRVAIALSRAKGQKLSEEMIVYVQELRKLSSIRNK